MKVSAGYELDTCERNGTFRNLHQIRLGIVCRLNRAPREAISPRRACVPKRTYRAVAMRPR